MFILFLVLFIGTSVALAYFFIKIRLIEEDIESLYTNYSKELEKSFKSHSRENSEV